MGKWYIQLESIIQTITKLEEYILIPTKQIKLGELIEHLSRFQSITRNSQLKGILPHDVKNVFSGVVIDYPFMAQYLHPDYNIARNPKFESG